MKKLLRLYRKEVKKHIETQGKLYTINIYLDKDFLRACEERIIAGHKKYGDDWKRKDNLKEIDFEKFDIFNYMILDRVQREWKKNKKP